MRKARAEVIICLAVMLACCACALALDPSLDISQYAHTAWKVRDGFAKGFLYSIAQTPDGYIWLGTEFGLLRFDGVRAVPWQPPSGQELPGKDIGTLLVTRDGALWIGTYNGLASWKEGKFTTYSELNGSRISALLEDGEGTVWVGTREPRIFGENVGAIDADAEGNFWVGFDKDSRKWKSGRPQSFEVSDPQHAQQALPEHEDFAFVNDSHKGGRGLIPRQVQRGASVRSSQRFRPSQMLRDRDGAVWVATSDRGLIHFHQGKTDNFSEADGLSGDTVNRLLQDQEGDVWVVTTNGIDRFREYAVPNIGIKQGLSNTNTLSVLASSDGRVWIGTYSGLNKWKNGQISVVLRGDGTTHSVFQDSSGRIWVSTLAAYGYLDSDRFVPVLDLGGGWAVSVAELPTGHLWVANDSKGLFHLVGDRVVQKLSWAALGHTDHARVLLADRSQRGLWLGFNQGGVSYFADGRIQKSYSAADGLGRGRVNQLRFGPNGGLWAATETGLSRIKDGRIATLTSKNGLPCESVHWTMEDNDRSVWLYMACGLVRIRRPELDAWIADRSRSVQTTLFDISDGVPSHSYPSEVHGVTKSSGGRIWFAAYDGVSVIDPHHLAENKLPPPVRIEQVITDEKPYDARNGMRLPARIRYLRIDYTALSLVIPEKVRFRYKLEGVDSDWREVVNDREVQYSNLGPGAYQFRVKACNNSGVWNEEGASLGFVIPPMWYQTNWFRALCAALFVALVWAAYQMRVRQLAYQFNLRLEERVSERTRIARDLHDTLLQSFQAVLPLFQAVIYKLPEGALDARKTLEVAVDRASDAITEGRDAVQALRVSAVEQNDLPQAIRTLGEALASAKTNQSSPRFDVVVEGTSRNLHPILRDEVYRVTAEALRNAFRHAAAQTLEVEIRYDEKYFRLRVRDDGKGIDSGLLSQDGREGHYGLRGMKERAALVSGKLTIWSEADGGTEIELIIPGSRAYTKPTRRFWYFGKRSATESDVNETIERQ
jgi:signal transduction histidine kinase